MFLRDYTQLYMHIQNISLKWCNSSTKKHPGRLSTITLHYLSCLSAEIYTIFPKAQCNAVGAWPTCIKLYVVQRMLHVFQSPFCTYFNIYRSLFISFPITSMYCIFGFCHGDVISSYKSSSTFTTKEYFFLLHVIEFFLNVSCTRSATDQFTICSITGSYLYINLSISSLKWKCF